MEAGSPRLRYCWQIQCPGEMLLPGSQRATLSLSTHDAGEEGSPLLFIRILILFMRVPPSKSHHIGGQNFNIRIWGEHSVYCSFLSKQLKIFKALKIIIFQLFFLKKTMVEPLISYRLQISESLLYLACKIQQNNEEKKHRKIQANVVLRHFYSATAIKMKIYSNAIKKSIPKAIT